MHQQQVVVTRSLACADVFCALKRLLAGINVLRHEAQPNNRLGGEIQCDARPDDKYNHADNAVLQPVRPLNIEFWQDDLGAGDERHDDHHIND